MLARSLSCSRVAALPLARATLRPPPRVALGRTPGVPLCGQLSPMVRLMSGADRTVVDTCKAKITAALSPQELEVQGAYDDPNGSHISIYCVADAFEGKRSMQRQQIVFKAIWDEMQGPVHAVDRSRPARVELARTHRPRACADGRFSLAVILKTPAELAKE
jgi:BolA protein